MESAFRVFALSVFHNLCPHEIARCLKSDGSFVGSFVVSEPRVGFREGW